MDLFRAQLSRRAVLKGGVATALTDWRHSFFSQNLHVASGPGWLSLYDGDALRLHLNEKHFHGSPSPKKAKFSVSL